VRQADAIPCASSKIAFHLCNVNLFIPLFTWLMQLMIDEAQPNPTQRNLSCLCAYIGCSDTSSQSSALLVLVLVQTNTYTHH